ncbi:MAG: polysaccharide biosynthesis/export family protein, partial [Armatimonadota bacterium]
MARRVGNGLPTYTNVLRLVVGNGLPTYRLVGRQSFAAVILATLTALAFTPPAAAQTPEQLEALRKLTPEQMQKLQELTPEQREEFLKDFEASRRQQPLEQPEVVKPAQVRDATSGPSSIEHRYARRTEIAHLSESQAVRAVDQQLRQFGYDLFAGAPTTFAPATDIPVPADYVIGPGDIIEVQLFGKENEQYSLVVSRDGRINFPEIGALPVA